MINGLIGVVGFKWKNSQIKLTVKVTKSARISNLVSKIRHWVSKIGHWVRPRGQSVPGEDFLKLQMKRMELYIL